MDEWDEMDGYKTPISINDLTPYKINCNEKRLNYKKYIKKKHPSSIPLRGNGIGGGLSHC